MNNRITEIRKFFQLSMKDFGNSLGVSTAAISRIESGERNVTDQMVKAICREYGINEAWLRTGEGDMQTLPEDETAAIVAEVMNDNSSEFYHVVVEVVKKYQQLDPTSKRVIDMICSDFIKNKEQP